MANNSGSFMMGFLIGAVAGAAAGVLMAPKSGEELRKDLQKYANDMADKANDMFVQAKDRLNKKIEAVKNLGAQIDETKYRELVEEVVDEFKNQSNMTGEKAKELGEYLRGDWDKVKGAIAA